MVLILVHDVGIVDVIFDGVCDRVVAGDVLIFEIGFSSSFYAFILNLLLYLFVKYLLAMFLL